MGMTDSQFQGFVRCVLDDINEVPETAPAFSDFIQQRRKSEGAGAFFAGCRGQGCR